jgi:hypothetical protein
MRKPLKLVVQIIQPTKPPQHSLMDLKRWTSFALGTGLAISEALPFVDNSYNGILHAIKQIKQEVDKT